MKPPIWALLLAVSLVLVSCTSPSEGDTPAAGSSDDGPSGSSSAPVEGEETAATTKTDEATAQEAAPAPEKTAEKARKSATRASEPKREPTAVDKVVEVSIRGLEYVPGPVTVSPGTTVRWTNRDRALHTVTSGDPGGRLRSAELERGESYEYTFRDPGQYDYYCKVHPFMKSGVTVE